MQSNDHTLYIKPGQVGGAAEQNKNPGVATSTNSGTGKSTIGTTLKTATYIQSAKQIMNSTISNIGFVSGNYELQQTAESLVTLVGVGIGVVAAPAIAIPALAIKTTFDIFVFNKKQQRTLYQQEQHQLLTGKISVNGGRFK